MPSLFQAGGANLNAAAGGKMRPLEVGIFSRSFGWVVVSAEQNARSGHLRALFADGAEFSHNGHYTCLILFFQSPF